MSNIYEITQCPLCKEVIVTSELGTVKVQDWQELQAVTDMLKQGMTLEEIGNQYCSYCLYPVASHASREEYEKHPEWLPYHEPQPQSTLNRYC